MTVYRLGIADLSCLAAWIIDGYVPEGLQDEANSSLVGWIREIRDDHSITAIQWQDDHDLRFGIMDGVRKMAEADVS